jgi:hypothetical protein
MPINIAGSPLIDLEIREYCFSFLASNPFEVEIIPDQSCYRNWLSVGFVVNELKPKFLRYQITKNAWFQNKIIIKKTTKQVSDSVKS